MATCVVCRQAEGDIVCEPDRAKMAKMLAALPALYERLSLKLLPGQSEPSPRVSTSRTHAPLPVAASALSLTAAGSEQVSAMLHPLVRRWQTRRKAIVSRIALANGVAVIVEEQKEIVDWHRELVRDEHGRVVHVPDDDQVGTLPPREWLDMQVRYWRVSLGDHVPARTIWRPSGNAKSGRAARVAIMPVLLQNPTCRAVFCHLQAVEKVRSLRVNARLGLYANVRAERPIDPLSEEIEARFGEPPRSLAMAWDVKYLLEHLDRVCDRGDELGVDTFAAELQSLHAEILRVLGEDRGQQWLGRCPAFIVDPDSGVRRPCGAGLWQQTEWAQATCPHCHACHDTRGPAGRTLAREIRRVWPVDRRRRYTSREMATVLPPRCPTCQKPVRVDWRDVTGTGDPNRWWQPKGSRCDSGCDAAGRVV